ncbi:hypothetical protein ACHAW5_001457 [Stephanodiscus triporus]|uniref:Nuclear pore complex protein n=1 Tax=Stephanodiscus triporus TaxID=2934178 RepID=A0ABD3N3U3_9STRA
MAQRAGEILLRMELCAPPSILLLLQRRRGEEGGSGGSDLDDDDDNDSDYSRPDFPRHLADARFALPVPTRAIYDMVLLAYAKEYGPRRVAEQAEDVVWSMIARAMAMRGGRRRRRGRPRLDDGGGEVVDDEAGEEEADDDDLILLPTTENWNCVLKCWSRSDDPDRAFFSYSFLLSWMEWIRRGQANDGEGGPNEESFRWVLRSCLADDDEYDPVGLKLRGTNKDEVSESRRRAREMGSGVAVRLWREMQNYSDGVTRYDSTTYHDAIRAICQTLELPSSSSSTTTTTTTTTRALTTLVRVYSRCRADGMLTPEITDLVKSATTKLQFARLLAKADALDDVES